MGIIASALGGDNALLVGTIILTVVACAFIMAMFGVFKKQKWGPMMTIGTTILNRAAALFIFIIAVYQFPWVVWTIILVAVSYLDYRRLR
jgi:glucan phosphoethanolaminetransferase (alkaline phosphatase superfamily)